MTGAMNPELAARRTAAAAVLADYRAALASAPLSSPPGREWMLRLASVLEDLLAAHDEDARRPGGSRAALAAFDEVARILATFDWQHGDRQLALEAIERAVLTGGRTDCASAEDHQGDDDDQADDDTYACSTCGAEIGIFQDLTGWRHFRGDGTAESPVEIYDAGHEATFAADPGGQP